MNRREILKSFIALPFFGKQLLSTEIQQVLPPTGAVEAIIPNINVTGIPSSGISPYGSSGINQMPDPSGSYLYVRTSGLV